MICLADMQLAEPPEEKQKEEYIPDTPLPDAKPLFAKKRAFGEISQLNNTILISCAVVAIIFFSLFTFFLSSQHQPPATVASTFSKVYTLNKAFTFPVTDDKGTVLTTFQYAVVSAQRQNSIILQGQPAEAVAGKTFLIVTIKITNPSQQSMQINSKDFVRFRLDNTKEWLAPEIYNDPLTVQAISTKYTRLGITIPQTAKKVTLQVGTISGDKTSIPVNFL